MSFPISVAGLKIIKSSFGLNLGESLNFKTAKSFVVHVITKNAARRTSFPIITGGVFTLVMAVVATSVKLPTRNTNDNRGPIQNFENLGFVKRGYRRSTGCAEGWPAGGVGTVGAQGWSTPGRQAHRVVVGLWSDHSSNRHLPSTPKIVLKGTDKVRRIFQSAFVSHV
jgi:hypothetical protein